MQALGSNDLTIDSCKRQPRYERGYQLRMGSFPMLTPAFPFKPTLRRGLALSALLILLAAGNGTATLSSGIICTRNASTGRWTLQAEQAPLAALLTTLATQAGFELIGAAPAQSSITIQVDQVSLDQVLRSVLKQGRFNYSLMYRGDRLQRVVLIGSNLQWASLPQIPPAVALSEGPPAAVKSAQAAASSHLVRPPENVLESRRSRVLQRERWLRARSAVSPRPGDQGNGNQTSDSDDAEE